MKNLLYFLSFISFFTACKEDTSVHEIEIKKELKEKELVFSAIQSAWHFQERTLTPESQIIASNWNEWRVFVNELNQNPAATISAYKIKTKSLVQKAEVLPSTIPSRLNKTQIKSRLSAILTKVKALNMFLSIDRIPQKRVVAMVTDLNLEVIAFNDQIEEIVRRENIPMEEGEAVMIQKIGGKKSTPEAIPQPEKPQQGTIHSFEEIK